VLDGVACCVTRSLIIARQTRTCVSMEAHANHCRKTTAISSARACPGILDRGKPLQYNGINWNCDCRWLTAPLSHGTGMVESKKREIIIKRCDRMNMTATSISRIEVMPTYAMPETSSQKPLLSERNTAAPIAIPSTVEQTTTTTGVQEQQQYNNTDNET
jgi:hypothetical protein